MSQKAEKAIVCGAGGFIGGHLVNYLLGQGVDVIRAVDIKPLNAWYQVSADVDIVEDIAGIKLTRRYNLTAPKGVNGRNSDNTLILQKLGWEPSIRLREGLRKTYSWIESELLATVAS